MDSIAQLALISKAKKVFGSGSTFLSFPVTPLAYDKKDLEFFSQKNAADLLRSKKNLNAFSTLVNLIPNNEAWLPTDPKFLWDEYEFVLKQGITAVSSRTAAEEAAFRDARDFLKQADEDGILRDSPAVKVYKQYRDAYFITEQEYMQARVSGVTTIDETEKQQWLEVDEPAFQATLQELENNWLLEGFKNEVEIARENYLRLGSKSPVLTWADWSAQFNPDISSETGTDQARIFLSSFIPSNALEEGSWRPFSLAESEIDSLIDEASDELRQRYSVEGKESSIQSMNLEFSSAAIKRPWFDSQVFKSRFWKLGNTDKVLSNGTDPLSGDCPAYVTAVVFARNITVRKKKPSQTPPAKPAVNVLHFNRAILDKRLLNRVSPALLNSIKPARLQKPNVRAAKSMPRKVKTARLQMHNLPTLKARTLRQTKAKPRVRKKNVSRPFTARLVVKPQMVMGLKKVQGKPGVKPVVSNSKIQSSAMLNLQSAAFSRMKLKPARKPRLKINTDAIDNNIYIFAFICKPVPKCPNPDPALVW